MIAEVIVDVLSSEVDRVFDYTADESIKLGDRVLVPFGNRKTEGYVIGLKDKSDYDKLKSVYERLDEYPAITCEMLSVMEFMTKKYHLRKADVLRLFIPSGMRGGRVHAIVKRFVRLNVDFDEALLSVRKGADKQLGIVKDLADIGEKRFDALSKLYGASAVNALIDKGILAVRSEEVGRSPFNENDDFDFPKQVATEEQKRAIELLCKPGGSYLLHGVTGSGKTEVYMQAIEHYVSIDKTAVMLVPEISLTPQLMRTFKGRFHKNIALLHSGLSDGERFDEWRRIRNGEAKIVIGARSAIFAPLDNVGIIIIDEEHDGSYVSDGNPRYKTVDVAEFRAKYNNATLVLGSATPSVETYYLAEKGKYLLIEMPHRVNGRQMPPIEITDMCRELALGNRSIFSESLKESLKECISCGNQAMIFINRRGYASFVICRECGYVAKCEDCDVSLTYHRTENLLKCHYCGKTYKMLDECPDCHGKSIRQGRTGTEKVVEELNALFPDVRVMRMDCDTVRGKGAHAKILNAFREKRAQILVGTQMIAKGHDFPDVTLVGILDADMSLHLEDYRSAEKTFQLVTQVAGRAGRKDLGGKVVLQTYTPRHYVFRFAKDYDYRGFYSKEINMREVTGFSPFTTIVRVLITGEEEGKTMELTKSIYFAVKELRNTYPDAFVFINAMRSPIKRIEKRYRCQVLMRIKEKDADDILSYVYEIVDKNRVKGMTAFVETNPSNLT